MNSNIKFVLISLILVIFLSFLLFYSIRPQKINRPIPEKFDVSVMFEDKITPTEGFKNQDNSSPSSIPR